MGKKLSEKLNDTEEFDLEKPSFEELCKKNHPKQWKIMTCLMWLIFIGFVAVSVLNNYKNAVHAKSIISNNDEVIAKITDSILVLEDGKYTDYSVDLEVLDNGKVQYLNLEIPKETFENNYKDKQELKLIYSSPQEYNLKSYYESSSNMLSNWLDVLIGYIVVFIVLFIGRHYVLKMLCAKPEE